MIAIIKMLLVINFFFVKALVRDIHGTGEKVSDIHERLAVLETKVSDLKEIILKREAYNGPEANGEQYGIKIFSESDWGYRAISIRNSKWFFIRGSESACSSGNRFTGSY